MSGVMREAIDEMLNTDVRLVKEGAASHPQKHHVVLECEEDVRRSEACIS